MTSASPSFRPGPPGGLRLACELVVPLNWKKKGIRKIALDRQFARTPYAVAFKRLDATFILVTLHVHWGSKSSEDLKCRAKELESIATCLKQWATGGQTLRRACGQDRG